MKSTTPTTIPSTLRRAFSPSLARDLRTLTVAAVPRISHRRPLVTRTDEELFGPSCPCGGCGQDTPEIFLKGGHCPDCDGTAAHLERAGCPLC
jgi:hypothetical protein